MLKIVKFWLLAFLVVYPFGRLTCAPLSWPGGRVCLADLLIVFLLISWRLWQKQLWSKPPLAKPIWLFLALSLISVCWQPSWQGLFYWLRLAAYFQLYWLVFDLKSDYRQFLLGSGVAAAAFGLTQYFLWPDLTAATVWGWDPHYFRAIGTFFDPNFLGVILVLTMILLFDKHYWLGLGLVYLALALTYSRSAFLALLTAVAAKKNLKLLLTACLLLLASVFLLPRGSGGEGVKLTRTSTILARGQNYQQAFGFIKNNFWWGTGFQTRQVDNSLLFIWANAGVFSFLAFLYFLKKTLGLIKGKFLLSASLAVVLIHSFFVNSFLYPWVLSWWLISLGSR